MNVVPTVSSQVLYQIGLFSHWNDVFQHDFGIGQEFIYFYIYIYIYNKKLQSPGALNIQETPHPGINKKSI